MPLLGQMGNQTDVMASMSKLLAMAVEPQDVLTFKQAVQAMSERSLLGHIQFGSFCSGSGIGDLALHIISETLARTYELELPKMSCAFLCELDKRKAEWLEQLHVSPLIFRDVLSMGNDRAFEWLSGVSQKIPEVQILFFGFSCKDLSRLNTNHASSSEYVLTTFAEYVKNPDAAKFQPEQLVENPLQGSTAGTLIGACQYVRRVLPEVVLMENVVGVSLIMGPIRDFYEKLGYAFFCSNVVDPTRFGCPNNRPRVYFGARRRSTLITKVASYEEEVLLQLKRLQDGFARQVPMPLESFLLDAGDTYFADLARSVVSEDTCSSDAWLATHQHVFATAGCMRPSQQQVADFAADIKESAMRQLFLALPLRSKEVAWYASVMAPPTGREFTVDLSQGIERANVAQDDSSLGNVRLLTFTGRSITWLVRARRFLSGRERLAMHGMSLRSTTQHGSDTLLGDLAGNSFSAPCFMAAVFSACRP